MGWRDFRQWRALAFPARLAVVLAVAGLNAGCWQPLYGAGPPGGEGVQDKFAAVEIPPITAPKGTPAQRVAVSLRNALQFNLHNGGSPAPPTYNLTVGVYTKQYTSYLDPTTGRPELADRNSHRWLSIGRNPNRQRRGERHCIRQCLLRHPGLAAAFRRSARAARCRRSRRPGRRRRHPEPARLVLRRRDVSVRGHRGPPGARVESKSA